MDTLILNLHLFDEGAASGGAESSGATGDNNSASDGTSYANDPELARIPERARANYIKAKQKVNARQSANANINSEAESQNESNNATSNSEVTKNESSSKSHIPYKDLIKSEEYKKEHNEYMSEAIAKRLKKYSGMEETLDKSNAILNTVATKYGLDPTSETFVDDLANAVDNDTTYVENYAIEHDMSPEDARKMVDLERRVRQNDIAEKKRAEEERFQEQLNSLRASAEVTKSKYPNFDLDIEMQDEKFRNICAVTGGDTSAAYQACHFRELTESAVQKVAQNTALKVTNSVAAGAARPVENGISSSVPVKTEQHFRGMTLDQIRDAAKQMRYESLHRRG